MSIEVVSSGLQTTVQDMGRKGWSHMGLPESGAADKFSLKLANFLINKNLNSPVLECTLTGPILKFLKPLSLVITGADMKPKINDIDIKMNTVIRAKTNDVLSLSNCSIGCRSYIAFSENLVTERFLGSASTYLPAKLGGIEGLPLQVGCIISTDSADFDITSSENIDLNTINFFTNEWELRGIEGPEFNFLSDESKKDIFSSPFIVSNDSSRMGNRLEGTRIELINNDHMISSPMSIGTVQCPKGGLPIILGCDSQTLGGYPRVLQIAEIDLPLIGQLRPSDKVLFKKISIDKARSELKNQASLFPF
ncbi:MAG: hypothetical protein CMD42_02400 [Gammaproteobacteria bacterium]|nr:hypothetical protein [Gammaproteobacteria bacterium]